MWCDSLKKLLVVSIVLFFIFSSVPIVKCANAEDEVKSDFPATGFFYVDEDEDGVWWFVTPTGEKFYSVGVQSVEPNELCYDDISDWVETTKERLDEWGFNSIIGNPNFSPAKPYIYRLNFKDISAMYGKHGWTCHRFPDVFDSDWRNFTVGLINEAAEICRNDSNLIGYETDNEMKWGPDFGVYDHGNDTFMELFMNANATEPGKQRLISFLSERYDNNTTFFNRVWNTTITDFNDLFNFTKFGFEGWRVRSGLKSVKLQLFEEYPLLKEPQLLEQAEKDITDFSRLVAETYFSFVNASLRAADPNHLNLGVRFHDWGAPREVIEEYGKYCDVLSINYYRSYEGDNILIDNPSIRFESIQYGSVPIHDHWIFNYYEITGKPIIASECGFDSVYGLDYLRSIFSGSPLQKARTQQGLANRYEWYLKNCFKRSYIVGHHIWYSHLVDIWDQPHSVLVNNMAKINKKAVSLHEKASTRKIFNDKESLSTDFLDKKNIFDYLGNLLSSDDGLIDYFYISDETDKTENIEIVYNGDTTFYGEPDIYVDDNSECPGDGTEGHPYCKIQYAIDNASDGDTIFVSNGTYDEKIIINKSINLVGANRENTVIRGLYEKSNIGHINTVVIIQANLVNVTGFNITSTGGYIHNMVFTRECCGVYINNYSGCNISGNNFYNLGGFGIKVLRGENTVIKNNILYKALDKGGCNIFLDSSNHSIISNNYLFKSTICCLWLSRSTGCEIQGNIMSGSPLSIDMERDDNNIVSGNTIDNNPKNSHASGILLKESDRNTIKNNNFISAFISVKSIDFLNSYGNIWDGNYWGRSRILPKLIFGRAGAEFFIPLVDVDRHPLKEPYIP
jgi:parallel beta-helix repeat protein